MRGLFVLIAAGAACISGCADPPQKNQAQEGQAQFTNIEAKGNLQSLRPIGCANISELTNQHTPADIYPGVRKCIDAGDFERGGRLFIAAGAYGRYDTLRVLDQTAHQAVTVLRINNLRDVDKARQEAFRESLKDRYRPGSPNLAALCEQLRRIGPPAYYPTYMTQHGMSAFTGTGEGLRGDFKPSDAWASALNSYLHCR